ncbi:MAG TPA: hypothetical protein VLS48_05650, partial [Anaerolineales bacterium]|nr:hypothetical protein [Anaerolineales bacterium]
MAEVRCPMCGKFNPPDQETCSFCQARLKPLGAPPAGESPSSPDQQSEDSLDWLHELRQPDESAFEPDRQSDRPSEESAEKGGAIDNDWLNDMRFDAGDSETTVDDSDSDNYEEDWLGRLGTSGATTDDPSPTMEPEIDSEETLEGADIPDWMQALAPQAEEPEETPDWMRASLSEHEEPEVPDWMRSSAPAESSAEAEVDAAPADIPDWMREFAPLEEEEPEEALPDWLSGLDTADEPETAESEASDAAAAAEDSPDWLSEFAAPGRETVDESQESSEFSSIAPHEPLRPAEDIPEWLRNEIALEEESHPAQDRPDEETEPAAQDEDIPSWLQTSLAATEASQPVDEFDWMDEPETSAETSDLAPEPDVQEDKAAGGLAAGLAGAGAFASEIFDDDKEALAAEQPDWFDELPENFSAFEQAEPTADAEAEIEPGLAPAELPSWLEAMRPIGAEASARTGEGEEDRAVEGAGPLAGLSGVLPAEPEILRVSKPGTYSVKLQVTENQQQHADLLARLIEMEGVAQPLPPKAALSAQHILRLVIGLILIGVILVPLILGFPIAPLPDAPIELTAFSQVVTQLNGG